MDFSSALLEPLECRLLLSGPALQGTRPDLASLPAAHRQGQALVQPALAAPPISHPRLRRAAPTPATFFDDFTYANASDAAMAAQGWQVRPASEDGLPGPVGAVWDPAGVSFAVDPSDNGSTVMHLAAQTAGTAASTRQVEVDSAARFGRGTYTARVRLSDQADFGPGVDQVNDAALFAIGPQTRGGYSEDDLEYLPLGGRGQPSASLFVTTWRTLKRSVERAVPGSLAGWHTLSFQVRPGGVWYYVDGRRVAAQRRSGRQAAMAISFNLWFLPEGLNSSLVPRGYSMDIDWVYFSTSLSLSPAGAVAAVDALKGQGIARQDNMPAAL